MTNLLDTLCNIDKKRILNFEVAVETLTKDKAESLVSFFNVFVNSKLTEKKIDPINKFISAWNGMLMTLVKGIIFISLTMMVTGFKSILTSVAIITYLIYFMKHTILDIAKSIQRKDIDKVGNIISGFGYSIGKMGMILIGLSLVTKFIGIPVVIMSLLILNLTIRGLKKLIIDLADAKLDKSMKHV